MKVIWKYQFKLNLNPFNIDLPVRAQILSIQSQENIPTMWALVDDKALVEQRQFCVVGTGQHVEFENLIYVGAFQMPPFVWHLFEVN